MENVDVIVVGAGSSGLMAAISAASQGSKVLLIDKNPRPGRKLVISGGGRCNVTNRASREELIRHIPGNGKFLYSALDQFDQEDIIHFFESRGVALKEEDHGRMFPVTNRARTILDTLTDEIKQLNVTLKLKTTVKQVIYDQQQQHVKGVLLDDDTMVTAKSIVLATGGRTYPRTGATGDGYKWAKNAGHTIERLYPTESPILSDDNWITSSRLKGISLADVRVTLWDSSERTKAIKHHQMDMVFTHFGYSGPAMLRMSGHVNQYLYQYKEKTAYLSINLVTQLTAEAFMHYAENHRDKQLITILKKWLPERLAIEVSHLVQLDPKSKYKQLNPPDIDLLWQTMTQFPITAYGTHPIEKGFVTGGGVSTKEIQPKTMASKLMDGLYFCGELIDFNGYTGGYNITAAFVTGTIAGQYAAWHSLS